MKKNDKKLNIPLLILTVLLAVLAIISSVGMCLAANKKEDAKLHDGNSQYAFKYSENMMSLSIQSPQAFVYDVSNDTIIYTKGHEQVVYPGSTTKLLTALYALEILSPEEIVTPGNELELVKEGSSTAYIKSHHQLSVEMLIEAMLLPSGNDAAYALAAAAGRKIADLEDIDGKAAVDVFMDGMRTYAAHIGLCGTSLTVPDGYAGREHYTTTEDAIIVARLATQNEIIMKYTALSNANVVYASGHTNEWTNTNKLVDKNSEFYSKYVTGLKTGSVGNEYSLIFSFTFDDGREYIAGVFGAPEKNTRFSDAINIIEELK